MVKLNTKNVGRLALIVVTLGIVLVLIISNDDDSKGTSDNPTATPSIPTPTDIPPTPTLETSATVVDGGKTPNPEAGVGPDDPETSEDLPAPAVAFNVVDRSGEIIGTGILRIYAPETISYPESRLVKLELNLFSFNITATPRPARDGVPNTPPPTVTRPPNRPTATPADPIYDSSWDEDYVDIYQQIGASLFCSGDRFEECAGGMAKVDGDEKRIPNLSGETWQWRLSPKQGSYGDQELSIKVWRIQEVDGREDHPTLWEHTFSIELIDPAKSTSVSDADKSDSNLGLIIAGLVGVLAALGGGVFAYRYFTTTRQKVFISYRRADSQGSAGRIYDHMRQSFGSTTLFRDVDAIDYGDDFVIRIQEAVGSCDVLIAVIGPAWVSIQDNAGNRRLLNANDFVRLEIAAALERKIRVIPVLVEDAPMPSADDLPDDLKPLTRRNAITVHNDSFDDNVRRLIESIKNANDGDYE